MPPNRAASVAANVRAEMARQQCTQIRLAEKLSKTQAYVSRRLTGQVPFTVDEIYEIAEALNVPMRDLLPGDYAAEASA